MTLKMLEKIKLFALNDFLDFKFEIYTKNIASRFFKIFIHFLFVE